VSGKLPAWMRPSLVTVEGPFGEAYGRLHRFFPERKAAAAAAAAAAGA
jgi:hypothetical protein